MNHVVMNEAWPAELADPIAAMLERLGDAITADAKVACPVDTGALRESIHKRMAGDGRAVQIVADAKVRGDGDEGDQTYAVFVELGTRHMHPEPFLRPALLVQRGEL